MYRGNPASPPFRYFDKGNMAVVGKWFAVLQSGKLQISGWLAWLAWAAVHLEFLGNSNPRVSVFVQWVWTYLTGQRALASLCITMLPRTTTRARLNPPRPR